METTQSVGRGRFVRFISHALALAVALLVVAWPVSRADAQGGELGQMLVIANPLTSRSVDLAKSIFNLDKDQASVVGDLFTGYRAAVKTSIADAEAKQKEAMEKAMKDQDFEAVGKGMFEVVKKTLGEVERLEKSYTDDLKATLRPEQLEKLPAYERARRREGLRMVQVMAGEGLDLIEVLGSLKIDWHKNAELATVLNEYELSLDRNVQARLSLFKDFLEKMSGGMQEMMKAAQDFLPKLYEQARITRDLNRQTARRVAEMVPADDRARFETTIKERSYRSIYKQSPVAKKIEAASRFSDLTDSQKTELEGISTAYTRELASVNAAWASAVDTVQEKMVTEVGKMMENGPPDDKAVEDARAARTKLDQTYAERLDKLLTADQRTKLPVARDSDEGHHSGNGVEPEIDEDAMKDWGFEGMGE